MKSNDATLQRLRETLDATHDWPVLYIFKFIAPRDVAPQVEAAMGSMEIELRPSKNGRYMGITGRMTAASADEIIAVYERVAVIKGVMSL